ncbi:MAG: hypothetical protein JWO62_3357 [Acidimicrobiaceae bacterium]|nr:hypothetical protein [Acidimicrobiaceae bacterium]
MAEHGVDCTGGSPYDPAPMPAKPLSDEERDRLRAYDAVALRAPSPSPAVGDPYAGCSAYSEHGACACSAGEFGIRCRMGESSAPEPSPAATGERVEPISEEEVDGLARRFHSVYESWAPSFGWDTQEASQVAWDDLPSNQRHLMLTVVREVVAPIARERDTLRAKAAPEPSSAVAEESLIASYVAMAEDSTARAEAAEERVRVLLLNRGESPDYTSRHRHPCGCLTIFDLVRWQSVTLSQCAEHEAIVASLARAALDSTEEGESPDECGINIWETQQRRHFCSLPKGHDGPHA